MKHTDLEILGLSEREARVYYAALRLGKGTVEQLAREAEIIRTTTYTQISSLQAKGLMSTQTEGKKTFYIAENPENLSRVLETQKKQVAAGEAKLTELMPDLTTMYNRSGSNPIIRFFPGKEGIVTMRNEVLQMEGKELLVATSLSDFNKVFNDKKERESFTKRRQKRGIKTRMLFTSNEAVTPDKFAPEAFRQVSEKDFPFEFDIYMYDNKVAISSLKDEVWGVLIESEAVAKSMKTLFEMSWQFAK